MNPGEEESHARVALSRDSVDLCSAFLKLPVIINSTLGTANCVAFLDTMSEIDLVSSGLVEALQLATKAAPPLSIRGVTNDVVAKNIKTSCKLDFCFQGKQLGCTAYVLPNLPVPLLLGARWLRTNEVTLDLGNGSINLPGLNTITMLSTTNALPANYRQFEPVFNKEDATSLPPHRPHDHVIHVKEGTAP